MKLYSYTGLFSATVSDRQFADGEAEQPKKNFWQRHKGKILGAAALAGLGGLGYTYRNEISNALNGDKSQVKKQHAQSMASIAMAAWKESVGALDSHLSEQEFLTALQKGKDVASFGNGLTGKQVSECKAIVKKLESAYQKLIDGKGKLGGLMMAMKHETDLKALSLKFDQIAGERGAWKNGQAS